MVEDFWTFKTDLPAGSGTPTSAGNEWLRGAL